jgi:hypothetical protein
MTREFFVKKLVILTKKVVIHFIGFIIFLYTVCYLTFEFIPTCILDIYKSRKFLDVRWNYIKFKEEYSKYITIEEQQYRNISIIKFTLF